MTETKTGTAILIGSSDARIWGMSAAERLRRQLKRVGYADVRETADALPADAHILVLRVDYAYEQRLIDALVKRPGSALRSGQTLVAAHVRGDQAAAAAAALAGAGPLPASVETLDSEALAGAYNFQLRKREIAYVMPLDAAAVKEVESRSFAGSYKGVTDVVTKYVWPAPAKIVTKWCSEHGISPNQVTLFGLVLMFVALGLFWTGHYVVGLLFAWVMTFLDTVDGKLARTTMTYSKFGDVLDHGIDLVHPPFWWLAWIVGLNAYGLPVAHPELMIWIIFGGYIFQRIEEGVFQLLFGMHMHVWRPFDSFFRLITARRNPNLVILTPFALIGRPDIGIILVVWWIAICLLVHLAQIVQALIAKRRGPVTSWLSA